MCHKKYLILGLLLSIYQIASTQIHDNGGNIGIGTTTPGAKLHVYANNQTVGGDAALFEKPARPAPGVAQLYTFLNVGGLQSDPGGGFWRGFHYAAPALTVSGSYTYPRLSLYSEYNSFTDPSSKKWVIHAGNSTSPHDIQFMSESQELMYMKSNGNIGIGTSNPQDKLAVNGTIVSKKVKVTLTGWPDYVFYENYKLPSLPEVEKFIQQNRHLPGIPSAAAIEKDGLDLGNNQAALLKKIEELTLYMIDQNKKLETQHKKLVQQQQRIDQLEKKLNKEQQ